MVFTQSSFGNPEAPTPHGGPAFHGWKKGFGFGHSAGPGGYNLSPNLPMKLRFTPNDDRCFASSPFWRTKMEVGPAPGFGFGDRPEYGKKDGSVAPDNYGDVAKQVPNSRNITTRRGMTIKARFPSMEEKYRDLSWPKAGPGPGKYDTRIPAGQGSWFHPTPNPSFSIQSRPMLDGDLREGMGKPGPGYYDTQTKPGANSKIKFGTLYDINMKGRIQYNDGDGGGLSPGPARYNHKAGFDAAGYLEKITARKGPPKGYWRKARTTDDHDLSAYGGIPEEDYEGHKMPRSESSPAMM